MSAPPEPTSTMAATTTKPSTHAQVAPYRTNPNETPAPSCDAKCTRITLAIIIPILTIAICITMSLLYVHLRRNKKEQKAQQVELNVREKLGEIGQSRQDLRTVDWEEATLEGSVKRERGQSNASSVSEVSSMDDSRSMNTLRMDEAEIGVARTMNVERETRA